MPDAFTPKQITERVLPNSTDKQFVIEGDLQVDTDVVPIKLVVRPRTQLEIVVNGSMSLNELKNLVKQVADDYRNAKQVASQLDNLKNTAITLPATLTPPAK